MEDTPTEFGGGWSMRKRHFGMNEGNKGNVLFSVVDFPNNGLPDERRDLLGAALDTHHSRSDPGAII